MRRLTALGALVLAAVVAAGPTTRAARAGDRQVAPGQLAPPIRLEAEDGIPVSLAGLRGRVVLVDFWASWCAPCRRAFPEIDRLYADLGPRGFEVLAVNLDERRQDANAFLADRPHKVTVVFDPKGTSAEAFGLSGMPSSFLVGRDGKVRFVHVGYTEAVLGAYRREIEQLLSEPSEEARR